MKIIKAIYSNLFHYPVMKIDEANYDAYWQCRRYRKMGYANKFQKKRAKFIADRIDAGDSVLDIGCGEGGVILYLKKIKRFRAIGADISEFVLKFLSEQGIETLSFDLNDVSAISSLPEVDHVLMLETLEHVASPEKILRLIERKVNKSIFISFPNTGYIIHRLRMILGRFPIQWRLYPGEHLRFWTYADLKWWLKGMGYLERSHICVYAGIPKLNRIWKGLFSAGFIIEIRK